MNDVVNDTEIKTAEPVETSPPKAAKPLELIAWLSAHGAITKDERDAGEIVARLASFVYSRPACDGAAHIPLRDADGKWSNPLLRGQEIKAKLKALLNAPKTDARQRAVRLALVSRERAQNWNDTSALSCGLEDIENHLWPRPAIATISKNGVTLPKTSANDNEPQDATPERLAQAGHDHTVDAEGIRRLVDSPFERMHARGQLDGDSEINDILHGAGRNYYQNWYYGGLGGISGINYSRIGGGGGAGSPAHLMPRSEFAANHRQQFRIARALLGDRYRPVVDAVVLEDMTVQAASIGLTQYSAGARAEAAAQERLNAALRRLAVFYGLMRSPVSVAR